MEKSVDPRRFMREENLYSQALVRQQIEKYGDVKEKDYSVIGKKKIQVFDRHVTTKSNLVTRVDKTVVKHFPGAFKDLLTPITKAVDTFLEAEAAVLPKKDTQRGDITSVTFHCGRWEVRGNPEGETSLMKHQFARDLVKALETVSDRVDRYFQLHFPEIYNFLTLVTAKDLPGNVSKVYRMFALNDSISDWHVDYADFIDGFCAVIPFGDFDGGELLLPDISMKVAARAGDLLFFRSHFMVHKNAPVTRGHRRSLVYYTHQLAISRFLVSIHKSLTNVKQARQYCRDYWCYKYPWGYDSPVPKKVSFKTKEYVEEVIENDDHDENYDGVV